MQVLIIWDQMVVFSRKYVQQKNSIAVPAALEKQLFL